jgi:hypothetical protein
MSGHTMQVRQEGDTVVLRPVCHEEPGKAWCRVECPHGCEVIGTADHVLPGEMPDEDHVHVLLPADYCNAVEWLTEGGYAAEFYDGEAEDIPLHDGMAVEVEWDGDAYIWRAKS